MRGYQVNDIWLCDDGTLDTVLEYTCLDCGKSHEVRYDAETTSEYRNPKTGELNEHSFYRDVVIPDLDFDPPCPYVDEEE